MRGKLALITGASQGIGLAIARALAAEGCNLVITSRHQTALNRTAKQLAKTGVSVLPMACDVRHADAVEAMFAVVRDRFHRLDILINNAGIAHSNQPVAKLPLEEWKRVIETNLTGMFLVTRAALSLMKPGGAIVNNLSISAKRVFRGASAYNASKHGALGFTNTLREELRGKRIRVIALLPGATDTEIWNTFWPQAPRRKMMSPRSVARAVVNALTLPEDATVEEITILPRAGTL